MKEFLKALWKDEDGLSAVEYAIAGGLVVGGMVGAFQLLGTNATARINTLADAVS
ncbi:Flp family type IVb pilin [Marinobacter salinisoli]|uniref:Flp family type IVb pilin n=1 Tax=Marinobacter salinisoli TaxID=2769486 RepID=A0ABX7MS07_9GAMM|nr:Flp family type IVb pilin [Marinobacter salinisoli]QSP94973.1 Flp family type IVb pilin [Marinobacter salinisoli]